MDRRAFISKVGGSVLALPVAVEAQQAGKVPRVGLLTAGVSQDRIDAFREGLRQLGYLEDQNIVIEIRSSEGKSERLPSLAIELVKLNVSVIAHRVPTQLVQPKTSLRPSRLSWRSLEILLGPDSRPV